MIIKDLPDGLEKQDKINWIAERIDDLIYEAKSMIKEADSIPFMVITERSDFLDKAGLESNVEGVIKVRVIINTTNLLDSHDDVHIKGIWKKSLKENKRIKHKQEHGRTFKDIIADKEDLKAYTKMYSWRDLGYDKDGETEALVFDSTIRKSRNEEMYNEYKNGNVDNHSVGMIYGKMLFAADSELDEHAQLKINWEKYYPEIANKEDADTRGYFWAILEAKAREGSAVPDGSNFITPTLSTSRKTHSQKAKRKAEQSLSEQTKGILNFLKH